MSGKIYVTLTCEKIKCAVQAFEVNFKTNVSQSKCAAILFFNYLSLKILKYLMARSTVQLILGPIFTSLGTSSYTAPFLKSSLCDQGDR